MVILWKGKCLLHGSIHTSEETWRKSNYSNCNYITVLADVLAAYQCGIGRTVAIIIT